MKKLYSTLMMLAMMVAALGFTACGGDDDEGGDNGGGGGGYDDNQYCEITINGETISDSYSGAHLFYYWETYSYKGMECYYYGGVAKMIPISYQDDMNIAIYAGYVSEDGQNVFPKSEGEYMIIIPKDNDNHFNNNVGMEITGGNMKFRTVTLGSLKISKVNKCKSRQSKILYGREDGYATEGSFSFTLKDNWDDNINKVSGKFRIVF